MIEYIFQFKATSKGKGKGGKGGKGGFQGECSHCGKYGHKKTQCWVLDQEIDEFRATKGKGKGDSKGGDSKGWNRNDSKGWGKGDSKGGWNNNQGGGWKGKGGYNYGQKGGGKGGGQYWLDEQGPTQYDKSWDLAIFTEVPGEFKRKRK